MSVEVRSYQDHRGHIRELLAPLAPGLNACAWSIQRFPASIGDVAWDGLTDAAHRSLQETIDRVSLLQQQAQSLGPHDEVAAIEVHPDGVEFRGLVWEVLGLCRTRKSTAVCAVSDAFVNSWDYQVEQVWTSPE